MARRQWYLGVPDAERLSPASASLRSLSQGAGGGPRHSHSHSLATCGALKGSYGRHSHDGERQALQARPLNPFYEVSDRIPLPSSMSSLSVIDVISKLSHLLSIHQIAFTFVEACDTSVGGPDTQVRGLAKGAVVECDEAN
ncbi:hypothetical protein EV182_006460, partial [Spiromyces aspiralis]